MTGPTIRVEGALNSALIIDDHPLFCDALSMTLKASIGIEKVATVGALEEGLSHLEEHPRCPWSSYRPCPNRG